MWTIDGASGIGSDFRWKEVLQVVESDQQNPK
jgi:hypothetical protein